MASKITDIGPPPYWLITLMSIGDGVIVTDREGRVTLMNPVAEQLTAWKLAEARDKPLSEVFRIVNEDTRQTAENPVGRVIAEGCIVGLANHTLLICRDGREVPIAGSAAPVKDADDATVGAVLVFKDQTADRLAQRALQKSEQLCRSLFENMLNGLALCKMIYDEQGTPDDFIYLDVNKAFETQTGLKDVIGKRVSEVIPGIWETDRKLLETYGRVASTGNPESFETYIRALKMWFYISVYCPQKDHFVAVFDVITERKCAGDALRESEETFSKAFKNSPVAMSMTSVIDGAYHDVNDIFLRDTGYTREQILGRTSRELQLFVDPADRERITGEVRRSGRVYGIACPLRMKNGNVLNTLVSCCAISVGGRAYFLSAIVDVTAQKRAEEALRESEKRYRNIFNNAVEGMFQTTPAGLHKTVNPAFASMFGYDSPEDMVASVTDIGLQQYANPEERQSLMKVLGGTGGVVKDYELHLLRRDRSPFWASMSARLVHEGAGNEAFIEGTMIDITERKRLREQLLQSQKMESVGRLAGGVAHDFNNLLTAISGNLSIALAAVDKDTQLRGPLEEAVKAAQSATGLTRQLLTFSRKQILDPKMLNVNEVISRSQKMLGRLIGEDVELRAVLGDNLGDVKADAAQLEQIIMNLAVNARDALPAGGILTLETANVTLDEEYHATHESTQPGNYVMIAVSDNGTGMSSDVKSHLFEPFFTTKGVGKGTGLGLSTVFGAVKQNGGTIEVHSEAGRGTTVKIYLPRAGVAAGHVSDLPSGEMPRGTETVILVEDEKIVRGYAERVLRMLGYQVHSFGSGNAALSGVKKLPAPPALLVTDVVMPGINGKVLAENMRTAFPGLKVLFTSGYPEDVVAHHGVLDEGIAFIGKPYTPQAFAWKIRNVLDNEG